MRKLVLILLMFVSTNLIANAYVDSQHTASEQFLVNTGYSKEMRKMVEVSNLNTYREPYQEVKTPQNIMRRVYHYIVPGQGQDLDVYNHNIHANGPSWKDY